MIYTKVLIKVTNIGILNLTSILASFFLKLKGYVFIKQYITRSPFMSDSTYFSPKFTGGSHSSRGYNYQDVSAFFCLFNFLNHDETVNSIGFEMTNDFTINLNDQDFTVQVKKQSLGIIEINKILKETVIKGNNNKVMLIATDFKKDLEKIIHVRNQYINAMNSDLNIEWKEHIQNEFEQLLITNKIDDNIRNLFISGEFIKLPEEMSELALIAAVYRWAEKEKISLNIDHFLDTLNSRAKKYRSQRNELDYDELKNIVKEHSIESLARNIIKEAYESQFIRPSQILSVLGPTQKDILNSLEDKLMTANDFINTKNYNEALNIFLNLAEIYSTIEININCAMLLEMTGKYETAIEYCNKIINHDPGNYAAYHIKGTSLGSLKSYPDALKNLEKALSINTTSEAHYNLGYIYMISEEHDTSKAIEHFNASLDLNNTFPSAHLNISICYFNYGDYKKSLYHVDKAIVLDHNLSKAYSHKGELYRFVSLNDDAIEYYLKCLSSEKDNYTSLLGISLCYVGKGFISEAILSFKNLFDKHLGMFINERKLGQKVGIIDLGWAQTQYIIFELLDEKTVNVHINNDLLPIPLEKTNDQIFIGALPISDKNSTILYPVVGKLFGNKTEYEKIINRLKNTINLFQYFETPTHVNFEKEIEVIVKEREKHVLIEMIFGGEFQIIGLTDHKSGGLEAFEDNFNKSGQFRIHLESLETKEVFIIDGIETVNITKLI